jgi:hypothetical protein
MRVGDHHFNLLILGFHAPISGSRVEPADGEMKDYNQYDRNHEVGIVAPFMQAAGRPSGKRTVVIHSRCCEIEKISLDK